MKAPELVPNLERIDTELTTTDHLTGLDRQILTVLADGRATRRYLDRQIPGEQASWIGKRLARLVDEDIVEHVGRGFYNLPWEYRERGDVTVVVEPDELAHSIREHLRERDDLVPDEYQGRSENPLETLCYVASEAYYYARGRPDDLQPNRIEWPDGSSHWFLTSGDVVIDLSLEDPDPWLAVDDATARPFLSNPYPSNRTKDVLERLGLAETAVVSDD